MANDLLKAVHQYCEANDTDLLAFFGDIDRPADDKLIDLCRNRARRKNIILMLTTRGGDPNAAFRMARCLQVVYSPTQTDSATLGNKKDQNGKFTVLINSVCKSAGTLIALGADRLLMTGNAELGPLDTQLRKPDEVGERTSSLTPIQALNYLERQAVSLFKAQFKTLRFDNELVFSTKMAAELATSLTTGLLSPIYGQIDPLRLAEVNRSLSISSEYAARIARNLKPAMLEKIVAGYPSHGFVIDREEAKELFRLVDKPAPDLFLIAEAFKSISEGYLERGEDFFMFLNDRLDEPEERDENPEQQASDGQGGEHSREGSGEGGKDPDSEEANENVRSIGLKK